MRVHQIIAIAIALVAGFGVKQLFFPASMAGANVDAVRSSSFGLPADMPSSG
jgi:hypothetical protein